MRFLLALAAPLALAGCLTATPPVSTAPPAPASPQTPQPAPQPAARAVPPFSFTPTSRTLSTGGTGTKTDAQLVEIAGNTSQWPTLCALHPALQIPEEDLPPAATQRTVFAGLKECATLGVETNPITQTNLAAAAGGSIGQAAFAAASKPLDNAVSNGAVISEIATNDPLALALSLGMTRPAAYQQIATFIAAMQQHYPGAVVGFDAVYPKMLGAQQIADIQGLNAALQSLGSRGLDFVREDLNPPAMPGEGGSYADLKLVSDYAGSIGLPFEVILSGDDGYDACVKQSGAPAAPADDPCWPNGLNTVAAAIWAAGMRPIFSVQPFAEGVPSQALPESDPNTTTGAALGIALTYR